MSVCLSSPPLKQTLSPSLNSRNHSRIGRHRTLKKGPIIRHKHGGSRLQNERKILANREGPHPMMLVSISGDGDGPRVVSVASAHPDAEGCRAGWIGGAWGSRWSYSNRRPGKDGTARVDWTGGSIVPANANANANEWTNDPGVGGVGTSTRRRARLFIDTSLLPLCCVRSVIDSCTRDTAMIPGPKNRRCITSCWTLAPNTSCRHADGWGGVPRGAYLKRLLGACVAIRCCRV